jgi:hypothetical protein
VIETSCNIVEALQPLLEMKAICSRKRIDFLVLLAPDEIQVTPELAARVIKRSYEPYQQYWGPDHPNRIILDLLLSNDIDVIDLLPAFREASRERDLYIPRNTHRNIAGNRLAGEQIYKWLATKISSTPATN